MLKLDKFKPLLPNAETMSPRLDNIFIPTTAVLIKLAASTGPTNGIGIWTSPTKSANLYVKYDTALFAILSPTCPITLLIKFSSLACIGVLSVTLSSSYAVFVNIFWYVMAVFVKLIISDVVSCASALKSATFIPNSSAYCCWATRLPLCDISMPCL